MMPLWKTVRGLLEKNGDPFKVALYKLIGRLDISKKTIPKVTDTTEDWMWFQLNLVREHVQAGESASERYTLKDLGNIVLRYGEDHYDEKRTRPFMFFQQLVMTGQFERVSTLPLERIG